MKRFLTSSLLLASASVSFGQVSIAPDRGVDVYETPDGQVVAADITGTSDPYVKVRIRRRYSDAW